MITLISRWTLKHGCPVDLVAALRELARRIADEEPGTLMYLVHLGAPGPLGAHDLPAEPPAPSIPWAEQKEVTFIESYRDASAFSAHVTGPLFTAFREWSLPYFQEDGSRPGWPHTQTTFYEREAALIGSVVASDEGASPAAALLRCTLEAVVRKDVGALDRVFAPEIRAIVPLVDPKSAIDRASLLDWLHTTCSTTGAARLDPSVLAATPGAAGAVITNTAFVGDSAAPPGNRPDLTGRAALPWRSVPTIAAAHTDPAGTRLDRFFFVTDAPHQPDHGLMRERVEGWYRAYVGKDLHGFMGALSDKLKARSFNAYASAAPVTKSRYRKAFKRWVARTGDAGYVLDAMVAHGRWVASSVQFLAEDRHTGQQKMTREIHVIKLDGDLKLRRAFFYETNRCDHPKSPCIW